MEQGKKCMIGGCFNIVVAKDLCAAHYKRRQRHGHVLDTRPADWGAREKHPLYRCWNALMRYHRQQTEERWHDFWSFVSDVGDSRPSPKHLITRQNREAKYGPANVYWRRPRVTGEGDQRKAAIAANMREWYAANAEKVKNTEMRRRYGISFADYQRMFEDQGSKCALCSCEEIRIDHRTKKISRLAVDHDHKTGAVRALLCHTCNNGLGAFKDDPDRLRAAIVYLERYAPQLDAEPGTLPAHMN